MRIKIRLYVSDLDLIALKYNRYIKLSKLFSTALIEYVRTGKCTQTVIEPDILSSYKYKPEQIDFSINEKEYSDVIDWLQNITAGMRSYVIKTIVRSSISNPMLYLYAKNGVMESLIKKVEENKNNKNTVKFDSENLSVKTTTDESVMDLTEDLDFFDNL